MSKKIFINNKLRLCKCEYHTNVEVQFAITLDDKLAGINMSVSFNDKTYSAQLYYLEYFNSTKDDADTYFDMYDEKSNVIFSTRKHPANLTPENILTKLKTYILFS